MSGRRAAAGPAGAGGALAFVSLGSNIDPERNLARALRRLAERVAVRDVSRVWRSRPVGGTGGDFLNAAVALETPLDAVALKYDVLRVIETALGRVRGPDRNAPRTIDLDIAFYADGPLDVPDGRGGRLRLPDPEIARAPHVALPLADLAPALRPLGDGRTLAQIAAACAAAAGDDRPTVVARPDLAAVLARRGAVRRAPAAAVAGDRR